VRLGELQARFYGLVTAPEGVARTLAARGESPAAVEAMVAGDARLSAVERLDVYANMYFFRLLDVLRDDYPKVVAALGDAAFHNLVTDYLAACPPAHPSIAHAGAGLPRFLEAHAATRERPWLPGLATLERTHTELFDGPDADPVTMEELRRTTPGEMMTLVLRPIPCARLLSHPLAVSEAWESPGSAPAAGPETLLVWRQEFEVFHRPIPEEERALYGQLDGRTLQAICEHLPGTVQEAAQSLFNVLGRWIADGVLARG
jgi:putative DNA-binding protein